MDKCKGNLNNYCYCCGHFKLSEQRSDGRLSDEFKSLYTAYFDQPFIVDKWYAPQSVCKTCYNHLFDWKRTKGKKQMNFGVPMLWSEPKAKQHDPSDCYACANFLHRPKKDELQKFVYKAVESAKLPVDHGAANIPHKYPESCSPDASDSSENSSSDSDSNADDLEKDDPSFDPGSDDDTPQLLTQAGGLERSSSLFLDFVD